MVGFFYKNKFGGLKILSYICIMETLLTLAGTYVCKSPYHKRKMLPFNVETDGYVSTIEYKGWTAYLVQSYYTLETILQLIESGVIKEGKAEFPKRIKQK